MRSAGRPPRRAEAILRRLVGRGPSADSIIGDLHEEYELVARARGRRAADRWYLSQLVGTGWRYARPDYATLDRLRGDIGTALRGFRREPAFAAAVVATLALAIGAGTAIFSVVDTVVLRPLPFDRPEELVRVWASDEDDRFIDFMYQDLEPIEAGVASLSDVSMLSVAPSALRDEEGENAEDVVVARATDDLFRTLRVQPLLGRSWSGSEAVDGAKVVVISHGLWTRRFASERTVLGRSVRLNQESYRIIGVLPRGQGWPWEAAVWRPLGPDEMEDDDREAQLVGRLVGAGAGVSAQAELDAVASGLADRSPETHAGLGAWVQPFRTTVVRDISLAMYALLGAVGLVLLIACVNTANLLLARGARRTHEVAIRTALGAARGRVLSLHLVESLLLALAGGLAGIALGRWILSAMLAVAPELPRLDTVALDGRVIAVMAGVTGLCGILFGAAPAARAASTPPQDALRDGARHGAPGRRRLGVQSGLVATEVALSTVLSFLGLLLFATFDRALTFDRGFDLDQLVSVVIDPEHPPASGDARAAYFAEILARVERLGGVRAAAFTSHDVLEPRGFRVGVGVEGREPPVPIPQAWVNIVSRDFFTTLGLSTRVGTGFTDRTPVEGDAELVVNQRFADLHLEPGSVGQRLELDWLAGTVVGVVENVERSVVEPPFPKVYVALAEVPAPAGLALAVRTVGDPAPLVPSIEREIRAAGLDVVIEDVAIVVDEVSASVAPQRFNMMLATAFAALALGLAAVGIYGVTALSVASRREEIGIRRALGASDHRVAIEVAARTARTAGLGIAIGLVGAVVSGRLVAGLLLDVPPTDPVMLGGVALLLSTTALVAGTVPIGRAVRIHPRDALRSD